MYFRIISLNCYIFYCLIVWFEPTSLFRANRPFLTKKTSYPTFISPNYQEFIRIYEALFPKSESEKKKTDMLKECVEKGYKLAQFVDNIIVTLGKKGVLIIRRGEATDPFFTSSEKPKLITSTKFLSHRLYKPKLIEEDEIQNVSGAGDCFASGFIAAMLKGKSEEFCVEFGFKCSTASLKCFQTVPQNFEF